ncbi:MAG TPA: hypothetical protein VH917_01410 [Ignavibacteriaceae bacterium]
MNLEQIVASSILVFASGVVGFILLSFFINSVLNKFRKRSVGDKNKL